MQAQLDQFESGVQPVAKALRAYFDAVRQTGFSNEQAFELTTDFARYLWARQLKQNSE